MAIDLQPMAPIEGVIQVQGDITNARTAEVVRTVIFLQLFVMMHFSTESMNIVCSDVCSSNDMNNSSFFLCCLTL